MKRREFLAAAGMTAAAALVRPSCLLGAAVPTPRKKRVVLVGTGVRGISLWGKTLVENHSDRLEFVGLCDINPGRVAYAKQYIGVDCPTFTHFDQMLDETKPDTVIVTTVDATHHQFIIQGLERDLEVITEKPMTTDEKKCQKILQAEKHSRGKLHVGFNYRYGTHFTKIKETLASGRIGRLTSVDFHWYLNTDHGASYFRRWHGIRRHSGTLLLHKATHHFDLLNWWIDSDPIEVHAFGALEHYGHNHPFRHTHCRTCPHKGQCKFYWDITTNSHLMNLYVANEKYDGYLRDACLWRNEIDIFDKMAVQIKYANGVQVSYSLTTYSPFEGWQIAFNGLEGRLDSWDGIPWEKSLQMPSQEELHALEMKQDLQEDPTQFNSIMLSQNFGPVEQIKVPKMYGGHGGGDTRLRERLFVSPNAPDPLGHAAGSRDGAMSILIGIAARKSIDTGKPVKIKDLTDLVPQRKRIQVV